DAYEIPYTFSDPSVLCISLDKALTKTVLRAANLPTPDWHVVRKSTDVDECQLLYPVIAKPLAEGTGKGVDVTSKVNSRGELRRACERLLQELEQPVLVERFLPDREFTVGLVGTGADAEVAGTLEILLRNNAEPGVYSYTNKEQCEKVCNFPLVHAVDD